MDYSKRIRQITKGLRTEYYKTGTQEERVISTEPSQLTAKQGLGNFPAFYLEGTHCEKSDCGNCANCFYSQYHSKELNAEQIKDQIDYVFDHFDELVLKEQYGKNDFPNEKKKYKNSKPIFMTLSPTGSFYSDKEFPKEVRLYFLRKLLKKSEELKRDVVLHIEAHAKDVVKQKDYIQDSEESELLRKLNAKCILGFESVDEWSRNTLYNKDLPLDTFEEAISTLKKSGIEPGAFVFCGLMTHTNMEAKKDMLQSIQYLKKLGVFPVLMFANCQSWTIPDLLIQTKNAKLLEPYTVLDTVYDAMNILTANGTENPGYYLVPEPVDGPPFPESNIFFDRKDLTGLTPVDSYFAHEILADLRATRNVTAFIKNWERFRNNSVHNYKGYTTRMGKEEEEKENLQTRLDNVLSVVASQYKNYIVTRKAKDALEAEAEEKETYKSNL